MWSTSCTGSTNGVRCSQNGSEMYTIFNEPHKVLSFAVTTNANKHCVAICVKINPYITVAESSWQLFTHSSTSRALWGGSIFSTHYTPRLIRKCNRVHVERLVFLGHMHVCLTRNFVLLVGDLILHLSMAKKLLPLVGFNSHQIFGELGDTEVWLLSICIQIVKHRGCSSGLYQDVK